jgi:hypothetical protein
MGDLEGLRANSYRETTYFYYDLDYKGFYCMINFC